MTTIKDVDEIFKEIEECLTPWDKKDLAEKLAEKYLDVNDYTDDIDLEAVLREQISYGNISTEDLLDIACDDYGIAKYVAENPYASSFYFDNFKRRMIDLIYDIKSSNVSIEELLEAIKDDEDSCEVLKKFVKKELIDEKILNNNENIFKE